MNVAAMAARTSPNPHVIPAKAGISRPVSDDVFMGTPQPPQGHWIHSQNGSWMAHPDSRLRGNDVMRDGNDVMRDGNDVMRDGNDVMGVGISPMAAPFTLRAAASVSYTLTHSSYAKVSLRGNDVRGWE